MIGTGGGMSHQTNISGATAGLPSSDSCELEPALLGKPAVAPTIHCGVQLRFFPTRPS